MPRPSVMETDPIRTGVYAARVALPKYLIGSPPFVSQRKRPPDHSCRPDASVGRGGSSNRHPIFPLRSSDLSAECGRTRIFLKDLSTLERIVVGSSAVLLFYPSSETDVIGGLVLTAFLAKKWVEHRREKAPGRIRRLEFPTPLSGGIGLSHPRPLAELWVTHQDQRQYP